MNVTKTKTGWHYEDNERAKAWYKIKIIPGDEDKEPYEFRVETRDIEFTMEQYARNRDPFEWEQLNWNIQV
jgi:hypothetical protein